MEEESVGGFSRRADDWASEGTGLSEARDCLIVYMYMYSMCM